MDGFTFYKSFYDTLKKVRKKTDRALAALAVLEFMFDNKEPQGLSETSEIAFESFRHILQKAKNMSGRGGRPTIKNGLEKEKKTNNQTETNLKPIQNQTETNLKTSESESYSLSLINNHSPTAGVREGAGKKMTCAIFLEKYPNVYPDTNIAAYAIDWDLLDRKFQESTKYLQATPHDLSWVKQNYRRIIGDTYKDKEKEERGQKDNGWAFFDKVTEQLKAREAQKANDS